MTEDDGFYRTSIPGTFTTETVKYFIEAGDNSNPPNKIYFGRDGPDTDEPEKLNVITIVTPVEAVVENDNTIDYFEPPEDSDVRSADYYEKPDGNDTNNNFLHGVTMLSISLIMLFIVSFLWHRYLNRKIETHDPAVLKINYTLPKNHVIFSPVINGLIMDYLSPENRPEFNYALVKKLHFFKPPPTMYETVSYANLTKTRFTLLRMHCSGCDESSMVKLWKNSKIVHCPVCNKIIWEIN
jgi:ribosomal protein S27E